MAELKQFHPESLFLTDDSPFEQYTPTKFEKVTLHYGQLKLLINDMFMILYFWDPKEVPEPTLLSVGAASGQHYSILAYFFPMFKFIFYDPAEFAITQSQMDFNHGKGKFIIHREYFTNETAAQYAGRKDIFFTSDIRRGEELGDVDDTELNNQTIREDMDMQMKWVEIVNPVWAMLKFRLPYVNADAQGNITDILVEYLDGYLLKQPFAPYKSTETRLFPVKKDGVYVKRKWSSVLHQDQCFWHNRYARRDKYLNPFTLKNEPLREGDLPNDYDSIAFCYLVQRYFQKMTGQESTYEETLDLIDALLNGINTWKQNPLSLGELRERDKRETRRKQKQIDAARFLK